MTVTVVWTRDVEPDATMIMTLRETVGRGKTDIVIVPTKTDVLSLAKLVKEERAEVLVIETVALLTAFVEWKDFGSLDLIVRPVWQSSSLAAFGRSILYFEVNEIDQIRLPSTVATEEEE